MANVLYTVGRFCFRRHGIVMVAWLALVGALVGGVLALGSVPVSGVTIPGTESQRAIEALAKEFPQASGASSAVVLRAPAGQTVTTPANQQVVLATVQKANALPGVVGARSPFDTKAISRDGRYALIDVQFAETADALTTAQLDAFAHLGDAAPAGWTIAGSSASAQPPDVGSTEGIGVAVALLVLIITFGSLFAAGMTLVNALIGVGAGIAGITMVGHVVDLTSTASVLALMLGLAVGIDYSLFITSRYRHNLAIGLPREEAAGRAVGTAGSAVVFAGLTVVIALAGLSVVGIPFLTVMGLAAAGTVTIAVLVAITLLPAMLSFAGDKVLSRRQRRAAVAAVAGEDIEESETNRGFAWAHFVIRFRIPALIVGLIAIGVMTIPAASMQLALPDDGTAPKGSTARIAYDMISEGFGEGFNGRLIMVVHSDQPAATAAGAQSAMRVAGTTAGVVAVTPPNLSADKRTALLAVIPAYGPTDKRTFTLVRDLRTSFVPLEQAGRADIALTGVTAVGIDVSDKLRAALPVYLLVVVGLSFALLALVFRSILVPIKATLGFLLTIGATFGVTVAVFQWGWLSSLAGLDKPGPLVSFLPILLIGILFGLAMDYEVFLVSRMREDYVHGETAREAVVSGVGHGARVVVAAGLIMISVFSGFILVHDATVKSMGFALAFGVLVDAFVVRLTLVPAVMSFLGDAAWWLPRWIDRAMPNVDIEGESLRTPVSTAAPGPQLTGTGA
ncbi:MAG: MMPL family transporter [Kineosporiaceae bacterium]